MANTTELEIPTSPADGSRPKSVTFASEPVVHELQEEKAIEEPKLETLEHQEDMSSSVQEPTLVDLETDPPVDTTTSLIVTDVEPADSLVSPEMNSNPQANEEFTSSAAEHRTPIDSLNDETLEYIFCFLDIKQRIRTELVCKRWRTIGKTKPWKWPKKLVIDSETVLKTPILTDRILSSVLSRCGPSLRKLTLTTYGRNDRVLAWGSCTVRAHTSVVLSEKAVGIVAKYCANLTEMKLIGISVTDTGLKELAANCIRLKFVTIQDSKFTDDGLQSFFEQCVTTEGLEIAGNDHTKGDCFKTITKNLAILRLHDLQSLQPSLVVQNLISRCPFLQELRITQCDVLMDQKTLSNLCYKYQDTLKILHLDGYERNSQLLQQIRINWCEVIGLLRGLQELSLRNCDDIGDDLMNVIAKNCLKLSVLNVSGTHISDEGLRHLASAPSLKVLDISDASGISGEGLDVLAGEGRLEELFARHNHMISPDESCSTLALFCPNFKVLDVSETIGVSNMLVTAFCICLKRGFVKGPVKLIVGGTAIRRSVETCDQLQIIFHNSCMPNVLFDLPCIEDNSDSDGSDW